MDPASSSFDAWYEQHRGEYAEIGEAFGAWLAEASGRMIIGGPAGEPPAFIASPPDDDEPGQLMEAQLMEAVAAHGKQTVTELLRENAKLRAELWEQWEVNHAEHCDNMDLHLEEGSDCRWPLPSILKGSAAQ